jgi:ABC-type amino acid transport substrate-binding protein
VAEKLGIKVEYVTGPSWNEFLGMVKRKELDVMLNIVKTEDRMKYLLYTEPYIKNPNVIVSSENNPYETIEALYGKTATFPKGFFYEEVLTKSFPQINRLPVENTLASLKAVMFGRADAALGEAAVVKTLINKNLLTGLRISGEVNIGNPELAILRIGVRDDWPLLQSALMKAMATITPQAMNQIRQKWLVVDEPPTLQKPAAPISYGRLIAYGLAVFLALSLLTWVLIKVARKEQLAVSFGSRWFRGLVLAGLSFFVILVCLLGWYTLDKNKEQILMTVGEDLSETLITANDRLTFWVDKRIEQQGCLFKFRLFYHQRGSRQHRFHAGHQYRDSQSHCTSEVGFAPAGVCGRSPFRAAHRIRCPSGERAPGRRGPQSIHQVLYGAHPGSQWTDHCGDDAAGGPYPGLLAAPGTFYDPPDR